MLPTSLLRGSQCCLPRCCVGGYLVAARVAMLPPCCCEGGNGYKRNFHCSPSGKLVQIEYALQAVAAGAPSMGIKAKNGVVLAVEKKQKSFLYDESSISKVSSDLGGTC